MILEDFEHCADARPDAPALFEQGRSVSYAELRAMAQRIGRQLANNDVHPNDRVALYVPKDITAVAEVLGVLYAGATYVPLDPRAPVPRVLQILESCSPRAVIARGKNASRLVAAAPNLPHAIRFFVGEPSVDGAIQLDASIGAESWRDHPWPRPRDPAYILYTSGSTGTPKGVVVSHRAAHCFVDWARRSFGLGIDDRLTSIAQLSFDLSVFDIFGALCSGAIVDLVAPELLLRPKQFVASLAEWQTTTLYAVPSTISLLEREGELGAVPLPKLRQVLYAGEAFAVAPLTAAMRAMRGAKFFNLFGPTETNVCTYHAITEIPPPDASQVPIGRACDHLLVELLDDAANPVELGEEGELCVAGPSLMTEYFGDAAGTARAFHPPERFADGQRRYRTGDRAVMDRSGLLWFNGRRDRLVKRRGYRVELGDIEAALGKHSGVCEAAVIAIAGGEQPRILAFVVPQQRAEVSALILRAHCGSLLPPYMVPDAVEILDKLPRTLTGKVDFQLLRAREHSS